MTDLMGPGVIAAIVSAVTALVVAGVAVWQARRTEGGLSAGVVHEVGWKAASEMIEQLREEVARLHERLEARNQRIADLQQELDTLYARIAALDKKVELMESRLTHGP